MSRLNTNPYKNKNFYRVEKQITNAFLKLLNTKKIDEINIKTICDEAGVNRTTFYDHYANIDSIYDKLYEEAYQHIVSGFKDETKIERIFNNPSEELINHINSMSPYGKKVINCILNSSKSVAIAERTTAFLTDLIIKKYNITDKAKEVAIKTLLLGLFTHVIYSLVNKEYKYKYDEIIKACGISLTKIISYNER